MIYIIITPLQTSTFILTYAGFFNRALLRFTQQMRYLLWDTWKPFPSSSNEGFKKGTWQCFLSGCPMTLCAPLDMWCSELALALCCETPGRVHGLCYCFYTTGHGFPLEWSCRWDHSSFWPRFQLQSGGLQNNPSAGCMTDRAGSFERLRIKPQRVIDNSSGTEGGGREREEWERSGEKGKERRHLRKTDKFDVI